MRGGSRGARGTEMACTIARIEGANGTERDLEAYLAVLEHAKLAVENINHEYDRHRRHWHRVRLVVGVERVLIGTPRREEVCAKAQVGLELCGAGDARCVRRHLERQRGHRLDKTLPLLEAHGLGLK